MHFFIVWHLKLRMTVTLPNSPLLYICHLKINEKSTNSFGGIYILLYVHVANNYFDLCRKDTNYKRVAMASLICAIYMLEFDRQENKTQENALAPS